jgi:hypothetical protein
MRTRVLPLLLSAALLSLVACDKPSEADCQKAIENINKIYGQENVAKDTAPAIRKCRSSSKNKEVQCKIAAKDEKDLAACEGK